MSTSRRTFTNTGAVIAAVISLGVVTALPGHAGTVAARGEPSTVSGPAVAVAPPIQPSTELPTVTGRTAKALPAPVSAPKGRPPAAGTGPDAITLADPSFFYAGVNQSARTEGISAALTIHDPELEPPGTTGSHSVTEIAAQSGEPANMQDAVEIGWIVDPAVNNGQGGPHLFTFRWRNGQPGCYNGCGFVPNPDSVAQAGMALPVNTRQGFTIRHVDGTGGLQGAWWLGYGTEWIGHFPDSEWDGGFTRTGGVSFFGEVAGDDTPCTDMGNGLRGRDPSAATIDSIAYVNGPTVRLRLVQDNARLYSASTARRGSTAVGYGGTGSGLCSAAR